MLRRPLALSSRLALPALLALCMPVRANAELVGAIDVTAPTSASMVQGDESLALGQYLNVIDAPITVNDAFSGPGIIEDGIANFRADWIFELNFAGGVPNAAGPDLVIFDAAFDLGSYAVSTNLDGFAAEVSVLFTSFTDTGETRDYFFGAGGSTTVSAGIRAGSFDLTDLGVGDGVSVDSIRIRSLNDSRADLVGVGALQVPEPATVAFGGIASLALALVRSRRAPSARGDSR